MSKVALTIVLLAGVLLVRPDHGHATLSGECPPDSVEAAYYFELVSPSFTGEEPDDVAFRQRHGIPRISSAEAAVVADSAACAKVRHRVDALYAQPGGEQIVRLGYSVYPMRFGDYWVAYININPEPGMAPGGPTPAMVFHGDSLTLIITLVL